MSVSVALCPGVMSVSVALCPGVRLCVSWLYADTGRVNAEEWGAEDTVPLSAC